MRLVESVDPDEVQSTNSDDLEITKYASIATLKDAIISQIKKIPSKTEENLLVEFEATFNTLSLIYDSNSDSKALLKQIKDTVYNTILTTFVKDNLQVDFEAIADAISLELPKKEFTIALYDFFVIYRFEGICNFIVNTILTKQKDFVKTFKPDVNKKDLNTASLRKIIRNFDDVVILDRLKVIINQIILLEDDEINSNALSYITKNHEDDLHNAIISNEFDTVACPNFLSFFISPIVSDVSLRNKVSMSVYNTLFNTFEHKTDNDTTIEE